MNTVIGWVNKWTARVASIPIVVVAFVFLSCGFVWQAVIAGPFTKGRQYGKAAMEWLHEAVG